MQYFSYVITRKSLSSLTFLRSNADKVLALLIPWAVGVVLAKLFLATAFLIVGIAIVSCKEILLIIVQSNISIHSTFGADALSLMTDRATSGVLGADVGDGANLDALTPTIGGVLATGFRLAAVSIAAATVFRDAHTPAALTVAGTIGSSATLGHADTVGTNLRVQALADAGAAGCKCEVEVMSSLYNALFELLT